MNYPKIVSQDEWLAARKALLAKEKDFTHQRDALNAERRRLPMVEIEKDYVFEGPEGKVRLIDLFDSRRQLITYHFMFEPGARRRPASPGNALPRPLALLFSSNMDGDERGLVWLEW